MIDLFHLADSTYNTQVFYNNSGGGFQTWQKPRGCKFTQMFVIGGGGGGASGQSGGAGTNRAGGGGGGSSAIATLFIPTFFLPDRLYIYVGAGGVGGTAGANGGNGTNSYVSITPILNQVTNQILVSSTSTVTGGNAAGGAGTGNAVPALSENRLVGSGIFNGVIGTNGGAGGVTSGSGVIALRPTSGGAGGAGIIGSSPLAGGNIQIGLAGGGEFVPSIQTPAGAGSLGQNGFNAFNPSSLQSNRTALFFTGGSGGNSINSGVGGSGGNGTYGCGGGGGAAGTTGGRGGDGGNGLVIITCW